jgi:hypothetical protein
MDTNDTVFSFLYEREVFGSVANVDLVARFGNVVATGVPLSLSIVLTFGH